MRPCVPSIFLNTASGLKHHLILKPEDYWNLSNECSHILVIYKVSPQNDVIIRQHTLTDSMQSILINFIAAIATSHGDTTPNLQLCASRCLFFFLLPRCLTTVPVRRIDGRRKCLLLNHQPQAEKSKSLINGQEIPVSDCILALLVKQNFSNQEK